jgi:hypothetical protein
MIIISKARMEFNSLPGFPSAYRSIGRSLTQEIDHSFAPFATLDREKLTLSLVVNEPSTRLRGDRGGVCIHEVSDASDEINSTPPRPSPQAGRERNSHYH